MQGAKSRIEFTKVNNPNEKTLHQLVKGFNLYLGVTKFIIKQFVFRSSVCAG